MKRKSTTTLSRSSGSCAAPSCFTTKDIPLPISAGPWRFRTYVPSLGIAQGGMQGTEAKRLKELKLGNNRLKRFLADAELDKAMLKQLA